MANKIRIIPSILTDGYSQVKGSKFENSRTVGAITATIQLLSSRDVDEILFIDVCARKEERLVDVALVEDLSESLRIPFTVGGGIRSVNDIDLLLERGADKVLIGSELFNQPDLLKSAVDRFGSQAIICSIDVVSDSHGEIGYLSGALSTQLAPTEFAKRLANEGAGELLVQNISRDGTMTGYDLPLIKDISRTCNLPIIASSGAGSYQDMLEAVEAGADAIAAGALFQFTENTPKGASEFLKRHGVQVRV